MSASLLQYVFSAEQVRTHEPSAAEQSAVSMYRLMERAGKAVFESAIKGYPHAQDYVVLVGVGNNAGDGYIVASLAKQAGKQVTVIAAAPDKPLTGDALTAQKAWLAIDGEISTYDPLTINSADIIIDGLLGTGLNSEVREPFIKLIKTANDSPAPIIAIDLPSGIDADTGAVQGIAIKAELCVTFVGIKQGLVTGEGRAYAGKCEFADLGVGQAFIQLAEASAALINYDTTQGLTKRQNNSHKGSHGKLLCIGGNAGTAGAIRLTSEAALRTGAGMVKVYTHRDSVLAISMGRPELMVTTTDLNAALEWATCIAIGPGLGQDSWAKSTFETVIEHCVAYNKTIVVDADALNLIAQQSTPISLKNTIFTPHPGEAARLLDCTISDIESARYQSARKLAETYSATCVLKGAGSIIANDTKAWVCTDGNPALAVGGSGDVLTGIIAGLIAQGLTTEQAACFGVILHAKAGDIAAQRDGERGMLPSDLFAIVRELVN
ncbi:MULTISPECIES: NAD(P)H-hydrate dehydratase [unclassified Pseudoalteromonas]|uniref:NAD(P)H-hydrate dehydratase n=1 Tax=unclassified Pseudoalteromonas TaxID=194690 RepID=UPI0025B5ED20|nr:MULTISPECIES: NAD(P)H-hydrate dehydratase [unclassified Pseudoalteromonas]MDN3379345.1 NAD(P)H-hydrate dehydratase [Pseudoalteromonas sp. APC 3893]MDN3386519.1 NAD(P)H-hydrate dehydratase [Pseudoalteromonas sp. APC 4017]